jgi:hypothetical protein
MVYGHINYESKTIEVARYVHGKKVDAAERSDTFWHELTHAILRDMGSHLTYDERFVERFATRLNKAINSAKF